MQLIGYSIYDNKALQYHPPYFASTDAAAARAFMDLANDPNTNVGRHPGDYSLFAVCTFNDHNSKVEAQAPLRHVADAIALVSRPTPNDYPANQTKPDILPTHEVHTTNYDTNGRK